MSDFTITNPKRFILGTGGPSLADVLDRLDKLDDRMAVEDESNDVPLFMRVAAIERRLDAVKYSGLRPLTDQEKNTPIVCQSGTWKAVDFTPAPSKKITPKQICEIADEFIGRPITKRPPVTEAFARYLADKINEFFRAK
ncbi:MAG TPA: hypothetical protein VN577_10175 [Terriglobales bacterium]|nr:hypothetical protein [Terriglobales bacterium]